MQKPEQNATHTECPVLRGSQSAKGSATARRLIGLVVLAAASAANAQQVITVNTINDTVDFLAPRQLQNLPGPDGLISFREAVLAANNTSGPQTIEFAIPTSQFPGQGVAMLRLEDGPFFVTAPGALVDFSSQTTNIGDTNPNGPEVGIFGFEPNGYGIAAIYLNGQDCTIKGLGAVQLRGYAVNISGSNNRVIGCDILGPIHACIQIDGGFGSPPASNNTIGGTAPGEGNRLVGAPTGVRMNNSASNVVIGNELRGSTAGVWVNGAVQYNLFATGNRIGGPTPSERNLISGGGRIGHEGFPTGAQVYLVDADATIIEGNFIGTTADGSATFPGQNGPAGLDIRDSRSTVIRNNLISGIRVVGTNHAAGQIFGIAISLAGLSPGTVIQGNLIGTDATGQNPVTTRSGISAHPILGTNGPANTLIGGAEPAEGNTIAFTELNGIAISQYVTGARILGNSIHDNGLVGIDLLAASGGGVTPNDATDADSGGNLLQNFPVLSAAASAASGMQVAGTLTSTPSKNFRLEFFSSPACDPSGYGEGATFLGGVDASTDATGSVAFEASLPASAPVGSVVTATATRLDTGDTSEFSACITVIAGGPDPCLADFNGDQSVTSADITSFLAAWFADVAGGTTTADFDQSGATTSADITAYLSAWFIAISEGC